MRPSNKQPLPCRAAVVYYTSYKLFHSTLYCWRCGSAKIISEDGLLLYREAKRLFNETRNGMGYLKLCRALNKSGIVIGEAKIKMIMRKLNLACSQHKSYKSTTNSNHRNAISPNLLGQEFNLA